jgi:hypothetical protein
MSNSILISFVASSIRPNFWANMYNSLIDNEVGWEIIMVGPHDGISPGKNFTFIKSNVKPAQCYEIGFRAAKGEYISWTADDASYTPRTVDKFNDYRKSFDKKTIFAFRTVEDGKDITEVHRFIGKNPNAPRMAPFGVIDTAFFRELGGYDRDFICGQSENDVVMRVYESGGRLELLPLQVIVSHQRAHMGGTVFRTNHYFDDRRVLESAWMDGNTILPKRKYPVNPFSDTDILTITQGQKGQWI